MRYWWVNQNQTFRQEIEGGSALLRIRCSSRLASADAGRGGVTACRLRTSGRSCGPARGFHAHAGAVTSGLIPNGFLVSRSSNEKNSPIYCAVNPALGPNQWSRVFRPDA